VKELALSNDASEFTHGIGQLKQRLARFQEQLGDYP